LLLCRRTASPPSTVGTVTNLQTGQNKNQPAREILENGENPGIRNMRPETFQKWRKSRNSQNTEQQTKMNKTRITQKPVPQMCNNKRRSEKKKSKTKPLMQKPCTNW